MTAPAVAWYGVGSNVGKVILADSDTGWNGSLNVDTVTFIEGTASLGEKVSGTTTELYTVNTTDVVGEPFDFSSAGGNDGDHIFGFIYAFAAWDTLAAGGFGLRVADNLATDSLGTWYVGPQAGYVGGWASYAINPSADFDGVVAGTGSWTLAGNPAQLSGVDGFGVRWKITSSISGNTDNAFVDAIAVGTGYRITLGDAGSAEGAFADFITFEENTTSGRFGGLRNVSGILFAKSKIAIGATTGATNTEFIDSGFTVVWEQQVLSDGSSSAVASGFYELRADQGSGTTDITLSNGTLSAVSPHTVVVDLAGINGATLTAVNLDRGESVTLDSACSWSGSSITNSGDIDLGSGATFSSMTVSGPTTAINASALTWNVNLDPNGELDGLDITMGSNNHHAIEFGASAPLTMTLTGWVTSGFHASDNNDSSTFYFADRGSDVTWTLNVVGGTGNFSYRAARGGDTVNIVIDPVTTLVNVKDNDAVNLQNARVYLKAKDGTGPLPYQDSVTIARASAVATVTHIGHGMASSDLVVIKGITDKTEDNNGTHVITVLTVDSYTYPTTDSGSTSYTGTIVSTWVALQDLTDASGNLSVSKTYTADQPVDGWVRKSTGSPVFKTARMSGTISNADGLTINVQMVLDE